MRGLRTLLFGVIVTLLAATAAAQVIDTQQVSANSSGSGCTAVASSCAIFQLGSSPSVTLQISGTFVGTLTFEATSDGANWNTATLTKMSDKSAVTTATAAGQFSFSNTGALQLRARATAWTSGTANVVGTRGFSLAQQATGGSGGIGTVTSVGIEAPAIFTVSGSPVTTSGTLTLTAAGTSGGVPYFNAGTTLASSGALTANLPVIGGGAGAAPAVGTRSGNTTAFVTTTGTQTSGNCVSIDASGNHVANGAACAGAPTIGDTQVAFGDGANTIGGDAGLTYNKTTNALTMAGPILSAIPIIIGNTGAIPTSSTSLTWPSLGAPILALSSTDFSEIYLAGTSDGFAGTQMVFTYIAATGDVDAAGGGVQPAGSINILGGLWVDMDDTTVATSLDAGFQILNSRGDYVWRVNSAGDLVLGRVTGMVGSLGIDGATADATFKGNILAENGKAFGPDTPDAHTALLRAYDQDNTTYRTFATLTNGNTPSLAIAAPSGGALTINALTYPTADGTAGQYLATDGAGTLSFSTPATTIVNNIRFNNGKGIQTNIVANDTLICQAYDTNDAVYRTFCTLTAGTTPTFDIANPTGGGGLSITLGSDATGDLFYRNSSGKLARLGIGSTSDVLTVAAGLPSWAAPAAGGGALSSITAASTTNTIASGTNSGQVWNWALTSNGVTAFKFGETTAATNGTSDTQVILAVNTLATSTAIPLYVQNYGTMDSFRVDDVSGDTTPFIVDNRGFVGIGKTTAASVIDITVAAGNQFINLTNGTDTIQFGTGFDSVSAAYVGSTTASMVGLIASNTAVQVLEGANKLTRLTKSGSAVTGINRASSYMTVGGQEATTNGTYLIGYGYDNTGSNTYWPSYLGFLETSNSGQTFGDFIMGVRGVNTDTLPPERMRWTGDGQVKFVGTAPVSSGTVPGISGCTAGTQTGGAYFGTFSSGTTGACAVTLTFAATANAGYVCTLQNVTTPANVYVQNGGTTTTATLTGTTVSGDVVRFACFGY